MLNRNLDRAHDFIKYKSNPRAHKHKTYDIEHAGFFGLPNKFFVEPFACYPFVNTYKANYQKQYNKYDKEIETIKWTAAVAVYTRGLVVVGAFTAFVGIITLFIIGGQLWEMKNGGTDTHTLAESAKNQSGYAKATAEINRQAYIADNRAFIGPSDAFIQQPIINTGVKFTIAYKNTGREPVSMGYTIRTFAADAEELLINFPVAIKNNTTSCMIAENEVNGFVFPNSGFTQYTISMNTSDELTTFKYLVDQDLIDGIKTFYIIGCITYKSLDVVRHTAFCYSYRAKKTDITHLNICKDGWNAD